VTEDSEWAGHWGWVYTLGVERSDLGMVEGRVDDLWVGLPPAFVAFTDRIGLWSQLNTAIGSMIDVFEDDEVGGQEALKLAADIVREATAGTEHVLIGSELHRFLLAASRSDQTVEFWL
jgi:hypothetical protein